MIRSRVNPRSVGDGPSDAAREKAAGPSSFEARACWRKLPDARRMMRGHLRMTGTGCCAPHTRRIRPFRKMLLLPANPHRLLKRPPHLGRLAGAVAKALQAHLQQRIVLVL